MDDVSSERLRRFEDRLTAVEDRLTGVEQAVSGMEGRLSAQLSNGIRGFELALEAAAAGIKAYTKAHIDLRFGETMRRFQPS